ncbi:MAG: hypothetical protein KDC53_23385 [Saprospiraceae bacterium]|nr:hypothetical protein [Saprospiraceae bacterium]
MYRFILLVGLLLSGQTHAQGILNRVLRKTMQKAENKVEDMLVEKASDAIAQRIYKSMSDAFDEMLIDAAKQDSTYQADYGDSVAIKYGQLANDWMSRMNEAADVPENYSFDHKVSVEITNDGDVQNSIMYFTTDGSLFAMEQEEKKDKRICLIDGAKDVIVLYLEDEKGKKTAQAIPHMMGMGAMLVQNQMDSTSTKWTFKATGNTKMVAGYSCDEYLSTDGEYENQFYMTEDLEISWQKSFSGFIDRFAGTTYENLKDFPQGFMMESHTTKEGKGKETSSWLTKKVEKEDFKIVNADYEFGSISSEK